MKKKKNANHRGQQVLATPSIKEKNLVPNTMITYRRPPTLGNLLTKYKSIAFGKNNTSLNSTRSSACNRCGLCGHYGKLNNMVINTNEIEIKNGKIIKLKQYLTCRDFGIYSAQCRVCKNTYIGQTCTSFSKTMNTHRQNWKTMINNKKNDYRDEPNNDNHALYDHYVKFHKKLINTKLQLSDAFEVTFVERPSRVDLDYADNFWIKRTDANINKAKTLLPKFK